MDEKAGLIDYIDIGARITNKRNELGLTQEELAFASNVSQSTVNKIEKGKTKAELTSLVSIANVLQMTLDELLCGSLNRSVPIYQKEFADLIQDCSAQELRLLIEVSTGVLAAFRRSCTQKDW